MKTNKLYKYTLNIFLHNLFSLLEKEGVLYCILRDYEGLPDIIGNDVDLLVDPQHIDSFHNCLKTTAVSGSWKLLRNSVRYKFQSYWLTSPDNTSVIHLDAWLTLHWKGISFAQTSVILRKRKRYKNFYIIDPEIETGTYIIKDLIQNGNIKEKYKSLVKESTTIASNEVFDFLKWPMGDRLASLLLEKSAKGAWDEINSLCGAVRRASVFRAFLRNPGFPIFGFFGFLIGHIRAFFGRRNGFYIVLIGPDGSGKSTIANNLAQLLEKLFGHCQYYHGQFGLLPELKTFKNICLKLVGNKPPVQPTPGTYAAHNLPRYNMVRILFHVLYYSLDFFIGHLLIRRHQSIGNLIISDRYFYDWFIPAHFDRTPRWFLPVLKTVLPRPDLIVFLENDPDIIHKRKPELTIEQIKEQSDRCASIISKITYGITVSTKHPIDISVSEICSHIRTIMEKRNQWERQ